MKIKLRNRVLEMCDLSSSLKYFDFRSSYTDNDSELKTLRFQETWIYTLIELYNIELTYSSNVVWSIRFSTLLNPSDKWNERETLRKVRRILHIYVV